MVIVINVQNPYYCCFLYLFTIGYSSIPIFSVPIFSAREENSNSNFSSLSDIFSAPQKSTQQISKISGYPMHNSDIFSFFYFQFRYLQSQTTENIGIELYSYNRILSANLQIKLIKTMCHFVV
jgi:hypothetical protein